MYMIKNSQKSGGATLVGKYKEKGVKLKLDQYLSRPAAGFPAPGDDMVERPLDLNDLLIDHPESTFFVRVSGDSMEGAKIFDGDVLVVDRAPTPKHGAVVVAAVYGEMVVKLLEKRQSGYFLVSKQDGYEPIPLNDNDDCHIWGVVIGSVRMLG
jgi:DNA polymerase V